MTNIALITRGLDQQKVYSELFSNLNSQGVKSIDIILRCSNYIDGLPLPLSVSERKEMLISAGARNVHTMPEYIDYLDADAEAISCSSMLSEMKDIDTLILPMNGDTDMCERLFRFFMNPPKPYLGRVGYNAGQSLFAAVKQLDVLEEYLPGAKDFLSVPENVYYQNLYRTFRSSYHRVKPAPIVFSLNENPMDIMISDVDDSRLYNELVEVMSSIPEELLTSRLEDIMFGSAPRVKALINNIKTNSASTFSELAKQLTETGLTLTQSRNYLLMTIHGYRMIDNSVNMLKGYRE